MKKLNISLIMLLFTAWIFQACSSTQGAATGTTGTTGSDTTTTGTVGNTGTGTDTNTGTTTDTGTTTTTTDTGTGNTGTGTTTTSTGTSSDTDESRFIKQAVSLGMMEVEAGNLAQKRAQNESVRNFAATVIKDHTKSNAELRSIAMTKNIALPPAPTMTSDKANKAGTDNTNRGTETGTGTGTDNMAGSSGTTASSDTSWIKKDQLDKLSKRTGAAFDREYMRMMVNDHTKAINLYERASTDITDNDIKSHITKTLPVLRTHLDQARTISRRVNAGTVSSSR